MGFLFAFLGGFIAYLATTKFMSSTEKIAETLVELETMYADYRKEKGLSVKPLSPLMRGFYAVNSHLGNVVGLLVLIAALLGLIAGALLYLAWAK